MKYFSLRHYRQALCTTLFLMLSLVAQAQRQQISYIEETKNWYYVYDEEGKKIGGLSRSSIGELQGWAAISLWRSAIPSIISTMPRVRR